jgi:hypothetical protein
VTPQEWARAMKMLVGLYPNAHLTEDNLRAYAMELEDRDFATVMAVMRAAARDPRYADFPPSPGKLVLKVAELELDAPPWLDVHKAILKLTRLGYGGQYGLASHHEHLLDELHPVVRAFVEKVGPRTLWESSGEGGGGEARLRQKYEGFTTDALESHTLSGLNAPPNLRRVERANRDVPQIGTGVERVVGELQRGDE